MFYICNAVTTKIVVFNFELKMVACLWTVYKSVASFYLFSVNPVLGGIVPSSIQFYDEAIQGDKKTL